MGGKSKGTTATTQELSPQQQQLFNLALPAFQQFATAPPEIAPAPTPDFNPLQLQAQQAALGSLGGIGQAFGQAQQDVGQGLQALSGFAANPQSSPYIQAATQAVIDPIREQLTTQILPNIRQGAIQAGGFGGSRQALAETQGVNQFVDRATQAASGLQNQLFQSGIGALGLLPGLAGAQTSLATQGGLFPSRIFGAVGEQQQAQEQAELSAAYQSQLANQFLPFSIAQQLAAAAAGIPGGSVTTQQQTPGPSGLQTALGLGSLATGVGLPVAK